MSRISIAPANYVPLSPVSFLVRAARVYGPRVAVIHGERRYTYAQFLERARRLASALAQAGVGKGDTVAIMAPNIPEMLEAHYAVPMLGAVLCSINIRLDAGAVGFILQHSEAKVVLVDGEFSAVMARALAQTRRGGGHRRCARGAGHRPRLRGVHRRRRPGVSGAAAGRRVAGDRAELHLRHHRQSEGRGAASSRRLPERLRQCADLRAVAAQRLSVDAADVPLQRLDLYLGGDAGRRHACLPAPRGAGADLRRDRRAWRDAYVRRAGGADHADPCARRRAARIPADGADRHRRRRAALHGDRARWRRWDSR